ncbi:MAG TPA: hypothetical protein PLR38_02435 [Syntrophorhabdaceae bacterium]|nr:hypothetical protein [Syntrophorhabdaceae bacterium]HOL04590.1 hypothetical protein [Syntrophorhabdaceae bacterium]HPP41354.1 hypothetical protein [Syntrophorhabdaceae bacterium]
MALPASKIKFSHTPSQSIEYITEIRDLLGINQRSPNISVEPLPFSLGDVTAGVENEFQTIVEGKRNSVDLPIVIEESSYYKNLIRRIKTGDASKKIISELDRYLQNNKDNIWENSWVRFPRKTLGKNLDMILDYDLKANKNKPYEGKRSDWDKFIFFKDGEEFVRLPVSYILKLSLSDATVCEISASNIVKETGIKLVDKFLNDNTSPEVLSFTPVFLDKSNNIGYGIAKETSKRFFLIQLLVMYANRRFGLIDSGQKIYVYLSSHPPIRQKALNSIISDAFYRELFMNPCLSGWDKGEEKFHYMELCHQVLSRSHLNTISKLKDAGIITRNLIVLPDTSNISLANNGTHISIGSKKLTELLKDPDSNFTNIDEKYLGDLVIKIVEHFLPLFVGAYSASPYRIDFWDFHPERMLGFLPHELDYTHLRMIWRRWKKKADLSIFGRSITPFGPLWIDKFIAKVFGLKGDFVIDFRLIDYLVCLLSTEQSPGLDGSMDNQVRLKKDLASLGVFDRNMSMYLLYRLRDYESKGFSGFEGRFYSIFESILEDMGQAASLQVLLTALAYKYILVEGITHGHIPDEPTIESERRQIFFGTAIGIPTFFVNKNTKNSFIKRILQKTTGIRSSHRYPGYIRVYNREYQKALIRTIQEDATDLIEVMGLENTFDSLKKRIDEPETYSTASRLTRGILGTTKKKNPLQLSGDDFNAEAEKYYRDKLRKRHMEEAFSIVLEDFKKIDSHLFCDGCLLKESLVSIIGYTNVSDFLLKRKKDIISDCISEDEIKKLIQLMVLSIYIDMKEYESKDKRL